MSDELAGFPSLERNRDPITRRRGSNQWLGDAANHHDGTSTVGPGGNKIARSRLPLTSGPPIGKPNAANPLGAGAGESANSE